MVVDEEVTSRLVAEPLRWVTEVETRTALPLHADPVVDDGEDAALATTTKYELIQQHGATEYSTINDHRSESHAN